MHAIDAVTLVVITFMLSGLAVYSIPRPPDPGLDVALKVIAYPRPEEPRMMDVAIGGDRARIVELTGVEPTNLVPGRNLSLKAYVIPDADGTLLGVSLTPGGQLPVLLENVVYPARITGVNRHED